MIKEQDFCKNCEHLIKDAFSGDTLCEFDEECENLLQTNEQWFSSLSTEEKAKWLSRHSQFMYECGQKQVTPKIMYEENWEWWLKEKHE